MSRICQNCGKEFTPNHRVLSYCDECYEPAVRYQFKMPHCLSGKFDRYCSVKGLDKIEAIRDLIVQGINGMPPASPSTPDHATLLSILDSFPEYSKFRKVVEKDYAVKCLPEDIRGILPLMKESPTVFEKLLTIASETPDEFISIANLSETTRAILHIFEDVPEDVRKTIPVLARHTDLAKNLIGFIREGTIPEADKDLGPEEMVTILKASADAPSAPEDSLESKVLKLVQEKKIVYPIDVSSTVPMSLAEAACTLVDLENKGLVGHYVTILDDGTKALCYTSKGEVQ
ncbi:MAG: hypothetical protein E7Z63_06095 [Thermoplasmata archaeon]|nr:hypothetical protein [Thermoplasmata archaeon]